MGFDLELRCGRFLAAAAAEEALPWQTGPHLRGSKLTATNSREEAAKPCGAQVLGIAGLCSCLPPPLPPPPQCRRKRRQRRQRVGTTGFWNSQKLQKQQKRTARLVTPSSNWLHLPPIMDCMGSAVALPWVVSYPAGAANYPGD